MQATMLLPLLLVTAAQATPNAGFRRRERDALPQEIFRESVEPEKGGKVPESAHMRIELNRIDSAGLDNAEALRMVDIMAAAELNLPERMDAATAAGLVNVDTTDTNSGYQPGQTPVLKLRPEYHPESPSYHAPQPTYHTPEPTYHAPEPAYHAPQPAYHAPAPAYSPVPAYPAPTPAYAPEPAYHAPEPAYHAPVGPVLLEKRPYEVKSVQPLPISVSETYTNFDCRAKPYPGRHYADQEAGCQIYHFCHEDGKQDTYHCGYGTLFNEYLGTCDYKNNVHCTSGEGYAAAPPASYHEPAPYHEPASYHEPAPYHAPAPAYHSPAPAYHEPAPYQEPVSYHEPAAYQPAPYSPSSSGAFTAFGK